MQILPGIYLVNGSPYGRHQNGYLVHYQQSTFLIDSGDLHDAETLPEIENNALRWGFRLDQASHFLVTHAHFDHSSHAAELQQRGIKIVASPETAEAMATGDHRCIGYAVQKKFRPCLVDTIIGDGGDIDINGLKVHCHAAPGQDAPRWAPSPVDSGRRWSRCPTAPWTGHSGP